LSSLVPTAIHESARRLIPRASRLDSLGRQGLVRVIRGFGARAPGRDELQAVALVGDLVGNAGLFAAALAVSSPRSAPVRGAMVGVLAGLATLMVPPQLKIGPRPGQLPPVTRVMTVGFYVGGGLVAGLVARRRFEGEAGVS